MENLERVSMVFVDVAPTLDAKETQILVTQESVSVALHLLAEALMVLIHQMTTFALMGDVSVEDLIHVILNQLYRHVELPVEVYLVPQIRMQPVR